MTNDEKKCDAVEKKTVLDKVFFVICLAMSLFSMYFATIGAMPAFQFRIWHVLFMGVLVFMSSLRKSLKAENPSRLMYVDILWIIAVVVCCGYLLINYQYLTAERMMYVTPLTVVQRVLGVLIILMVLEATRRRVGMVLPIVALVFFAYFYAGPYLPGILYHKGFSLDKLLDLIYLTPEGIFGSPIGISAKMLILFIIFGAFLESSGFGQFLTDFSLSIAGWSKGGPAKVAVIASALMGMISGSSNANVVTTGAFTIPLMKRVGYKPHFAAAVEAVSSTGGQFMPPIMGAAIFLMVEYTGIQYITIIKYALLPSILYFLSVGLMVHFEAAKTGLTGIPRKDLPDGKKALKAYCHLLLPLVVLIWMMIAGFSAGLSCVCSIACIIVSSMLRKHTRMTGKGILDALAKGAENTLTVACSCACAGLIIAVIALTGIGVRFTSSIVALSGGHLFIALVFSMLAAVILGMGLPTTAAYVLMITMVVPALVNMGVPIYAAHLFSVYFSCLSLITPPVAITSYAAAALAEAPMMKTGWTAMRLGLAAYIVPFMFIYNEGLLLLGDPLGIVRAVVTALIGVFMLSVALEGFMVSKMNIVLRFVCAASSLLLLDGSLITDLMGIGIFVLAIILQFAGRVKERKGTIG